MTHIRPYRDYVESGSYWIGDAPSGWSTKRLRHIASFWNSNVDKKTYEDQQGVLLCNYTDVYYNEFIRPGLQFMGATASTKEIERFTLQCGDIIITKDSEDASDIGIPTLVTNDLPGVVCGYHLTLIRTSEEVSPRFLHRAIQAHPSKAYFNVESPGITRFGLGQDTIGDLPIVFPAVSDQEKISDWIDSQTSRIDTLIENKTRFIKLLKEKRQALITHTVTKGLNPEVPMKDSGIDWLGEVPAHWAIVPSPLLFTESKERAHDSDEQLSATQKYGVIPRAEFERLEDRRVTHATMRLEQRKHAEVDDFVISMRSFEGGIERVKARGCVRSSYVVLRANSRANVDFYSHLFKSSLYIQGLQATATFIRDGQDLSYANFRQVKLPLPPFEEQSVIALFLYTELLRIDSLQSLTQRSINLLIERRSALITAAVTGKIDLRDAA